MLNCLISFHVNPSHIASHTCHFISTDDLPPSISICPFSNNDKFSNLARIGNEISVRINSSKALRQPIQLTVSGGNSIVLEAQAQDSFGVYVASFKLAALSDVTANEYSMLDGKIEVSTTVYDGAGNPAFSNISACQLTVGELENIPP